MVQIVGTYNLDKNENLITYLLSIGATEELANKANQSNVRYEISKEGYRYSIKTSTGMNNIIFALNEEFDEPMPMGIVLKSVATLEGDNRLVIKSKAPDGKTGFRTYDFTDTHLTLTLTSNDITAKRYFTRV